MLLPFLSTFFSPTHYKITIFAALIIIRYAKGWLCSCHIIAALLLPQANLRKSAEGSMSLLEKDKIMLQHRFTEYQRKADQEGEKRRNLENEGKDNEVLLAYDPGTLQLKCNCTVKL